MDPRGELAHVDGRRTLRDCLGNRLPAARCRCLGNGVSASGWSRFADQGWSNAGTLGDFAHSIAVSCTAQALAVWGQSPGFVTRIMELDDGSTPPDVPFTMPDSGWGPYAVASLDRFALVGTRLAESNHELFVSWRNGSSWAASELLASAPEIGFMGFDSDEQGNIIVAWRENDRNLVTRVRTRPGPMDARIVRCNDDTLRAALLHIDMTAGNAVLSFRKHSTPDNTTWVAIYEAGTGWINGSITPLDEAADFLP